MCLLKTEQVQTAVFKQMKYSESYQHGELTSVTFFWQRLGGTLQHPLWVRPFLDILLLLLCFSFLTCYKGWTLAVSVEIWRGYIYPSINFLIYLNLRTAEILKSAVWCFFFSLFVYRTKFSKSFVWFDSLDIVISAVNIWNIFEIKMATFSTEGSNKTFNYNFWIKVHKSTWIMCWSLNNHPYCYWTE